MSVDALGASGILSESQLTERFQADLLGLGDRVEFYSQVRMQCWTHASRVTPAMLRIDYVLRLDGGPIVGVELKAAPQEAAGLGRALQQCSQYAAGCVAAQIVERVNPAWVGQPLHAVFLYSQWRCCSQFVMQHLASSRRLFGPSNVGLVERCRFEGLKFTLCAARYWSAYSGLNPTLIQKNHRSGNGDFRPCTSREEIA